MSTTTSENAARLRGVANGLRAAANALVGASEDQTADALRGVAARVSEASEAVSLVAEALTPEPEPELAWPTARHVWWDGAMWTLNNEKTYLGPGDYWKESHLDSTAQVIRDEAHRFAREAVPVTIVPSREWERLCASIADDTELRDAVEALITATKTLNGETNA